MPHDDKPDSGLPRLAESLTTDDLRAMFRAAPSGCLMIDDKGVIRDLNAEAERALGYASGELVGQPVEVLVPERHRTAHESHREEYGSHPSSRPMGIGLELFARRADGSELPVEIALSPIETSQGSFVLAQLSDITQRRELRAFGSGVMQGAEEERRRIARDLHDDTAQALAALVLRLQMARRTEDEEKRDAMLGETHKDLLRASDGVRRVLRGLRPPALEEAGLVAAIRAQARDTFEDSTVQVSVHGDGVDEALDVNARLALYRIIQEALTNAARHSGATRVDIDIETGPANVLARVTDNGRGFALEAVRTEGGRGLGIIGMRERATILGGSVRLESGDDSGTTVEVELPRSSDVPATDEEADE